MGLCDFKDLMHSVDKGDTQQLRAVDVSLPELPVTRVCGGLLWTVRGWLRWEVTPYAAPYRLGSTWTPAPTHSANSSFLKCKSHRYSAWM